MSPVQSGTHKDPILSTVLQYVRQGWPEKCAENLAPRGHVMKAVYCGVTGGKLKSVVLVESSRNDMPELEKDVEENEFLSSMPNAQSHPPKHNGNIFCRVAVGSQLVN